ncbi:MAG TPA: twin-arginine translocase TatA/TatE family subunit [Acidisarcina sp.]
MHFADSIALFLIALVLFGPKKLPEIARQLGKLMAEFRRASNEFKTQIDEELRTAEQVDRQKQITAAAVASPPVTATPALTQPVIAPPRTGAVVSQQACGDPAEAGASPPNGRYLEPSDYEQSDPQRFDAPNVERSGSTSDPAELQRPDRTRTEASVQVYEEQYPTQEGFSPAAPTAAVGPPLFGTLFRESDPVFDIPFADAQTTRSSVSEGYPAAGDALPSSDSRASALKESVNASGELTPVEGSAAENAQASIHHG